MSYREFFETNDDLSFIQPIGLNRRQWPDTLFGLTEIESNLIAPATQLIKTLYMMRTLLFDFRQLARQVEQAAEQAVFGLPESQRAGVNTKRLAFAVVKKLFMEKIMVHNEMHSALVTGEVENLEQFALFGSIQIDFERATIGQA